MGIIAPYKNKNETEVCFYLYIGYVNIRISRHEQNKKFFRI